MAELRGNNKLIVLKFQPIHIVKISQFISDIIVQQIHSLSFLFNKRKITR